MKNEKPSVGFADSFPDRGASIASLSGGGAPQGEEGFSFIPGFHDRLDSYIPEKKQERKQA